MPLENISDAENYNFCKKKNKAPKIFYSPYDDASSSSTLQKEILLQHQESPKIKVSKRIIVPLLIGESNDEVYSSRRHS
jgi:RNA recognition motif-containing protein